MTRQNVRHFLPASGRMTPINVCLWRHKERGDSNKRWRQRRFEPSQETGVKGTRDNFKIHVNFMKPTFLCSLRQDETYDKK